MSVSEQYSGIVGTHITAIEQAARSENTFIFIRPTEYDSTILIQAGYATKSMDVHHKSSNWGPMAGFVPCDPAFSKKCVGTPNPNENEAKHGAAHPAQLTLKPDLLTSHTKIQFPAGYKLESLQGGRPQDIKWVVKRQTGQGTVAKAREKFEAFQKAGGSIPEHKFCTAMPAEIGVKSTLFCLIRQADEWLVYWVRFEGDTGKLYPLRVFAYSQGGRLNPVTGDYDLWMVAPHFKHFDKHSVVRLEKDSHGSSAASGFTMSLMKLMNGNCGRSDNPVFHHGAEAQNYAFTQALDWNLAMFTPSGSSRMVRMNQMPGILSDLQSAGYLAVWNKRYGEADPQLSGQKDKRGTESLVQIRTKLDGLIKELDEIKRTANSKQIAKSWMGSNSASTPRMPAMMQKELGIMASRIKSSQNLGHEQSRIYLFHQKLLELLEAKKDGFRILTTNDVPADFHAYNRKMQTLHLKLQQVLVKATKDKGQTSEDMLSKWLVTNQGLIKDLEANLK